MNSVYSNASNLKKDLPEGKKIVFTNGCFDILHAGHIHILKEAARLGDILVVGLNDDSSVREIKGPNRPVIDRHSRAELVNALEMVDYVVFFSEPTPEKLIKEIKPDILVKGGEYGEGEIVGEDIAEKTVRIKMKPGLSTTSIIEKIKSAGK
ncbi:MAG: adenylyltransferase/cytidyltransferase family protein [Elusimicrobiota bacterium]|nr:adenylyltransferase/cytidyltransferase family protein [Elusimicrobiota bacterium]